jgi:hypothetical protein
MHGYNCWSSFPDKREFRLVPVKAGNQYLKPMDSPHQVRGKLCFRRNDKDCKILNFFYLIIKGKQCKSKPTVFR